MRPLRRHRAPPFAASSWITLLQRMFSRQTRQPGIGRAGVIRIHPCFPIAIPPEPPKAIARWPAHMIDQPEPVIIVVTPVIRGTPANVPAHPIGIAVHRAERPREGSIAVVV